MRITRKIAALLTAGVAAVALTACQADAGSEDPAGSTGAATGAAEGEAAENGYVTVSAADFVERSTAAQAATSSMRYTASFSGPGAEAQNMAGTTMEGAIQTGETVADSAIQMSMDIEGGAFEMILVDGEFYMNMGPITQDKYLHVSGEDASAEELGDMMTALEQADILGQTKAMEGAVTEVTEVGTETIHGVETHHYSVTIDLSKAKDLDSLGVDQGMVEDLGTMQFEYFLDDDDVTHRTVSTIGDGDDKLVVTTDITDHGEPVEVTAPPADQTIEASEMGM